MHNITDLFVYKRLTASSQCTSYGTVEDAHRIHSTLNNKEWTVTLPGTAAPNTTTSIYIQNVQQDASLVS
jgi:hypothetical protein